MARDRSDTLPARRRRAGAPRRWPLAAVVAVVVGLVVLGAPFVPAGSAGGPACAEAEAGMHLGLVVDYGVASADGAPATPLAQCVRLASGSNGYVSGFDVLQAAGISWRTNSAGLVCALSPKGSTQLFPPSGCGERTENGYRYWAYFHGTGGTWTYAADGPYAHHLREGEVEGWHFVEATGRPGDPPPNGPASTSALCPPDPTTVPPIPTTAPAPVTTAPPAGGAGSNGAGGSSGGGLVGGGVTAPPSAGPTTTATTSSDGGSGAPGAVGSDALDPTAAPSTAADGAPAKGAAGSVPPGDGAAGGDAEAGAPGDLTAAPVSASGGSGGVPVGLVAAVIAAVVLGGLAFRRFGASPGDGSAA